VPASVNVVCPATTTWLISSPEVTWSSGAVLSTGTASVCSCSTSCAPIPADTRAVTSRVFVFLPAPVMTSGSVVHVVHSF
jgi:hypothetical protein